MPDGVVGGGPARRTVLAGAAAALPLLLTACKGVQALGTPPPPAPDIVALRAAIAAEELMVARYAAAIKPYIREEHHSIPYPDVIILTVLRTVQAEHEAHLAELTSRLLEPAGSTPSPSPTPAVAVTGGTVTGGAVTGGTVTGGAVTGSKNARLTALEQAEQTASDWLIGQLAGLPPALAQLFASIAASEATHVPYLRAARPGR